MECVKKDKTLADVPPELHKLIIQLIDDKTKMNMRLVNSYWFKMTGYNKFTVYFSRYSTLPLMVDRFAAYHAPIELHFRKEINLSFGDVAAHITRLTNLTGLSFSNIIKGDDQRIYYMTTLTGIREWLGLTSLKQVDPAVLLKMTNLTSLELGLTLTKEQMSQILRNNSQLERIKLVSISSNISAPDPYLISDLANPSRLTELHLPIECVIEDNMLTKLINLKSVNTSAHFKRMDHMTQLENLTEIDDALKIGSGTQLKSIRITPKTHRLDIVLPTLTALESITTRGRSDVVPFIRSEKLTALILTTPNDNIRGISRLASLQGLTFFESTTSPTVRVSRLTNLTFLSAFESFRDQTREDIALLTRLKHLDANSPPVNDWTDFSGYGADLTNLENLRFSWYTMRPQEDCPFITKFGNLTSVRCHSVTASLTRLTNLKWLSISQIQPTEVMSLTALAALTYLETNQSTVDELWGLLQHLTNLQQIQYRKSKHRGHAFVVAELQLTMDYLHTMLLY